MLEILQVLVGVCVVMIGIGLFFFIRNKKDFNADSMVPQDSSNKDTNATKKVFNFPMGDEDFSERKSIKLPEVIVYYLTPSTTKSFQGFELYRLFTEHGVVFGDHQIFHCQEDGEVLFSIAKSEEPGTFDEQLMKEVDVPGMAVFCQYKVLKDPSVAYERMMNLCYRICRELGGTIMTQEQKTVLHDDVETIIAELNRIEVSVGDEY